MRVAIVGAGLAGLAAAAALTESGHHVTVHEQADELRAGGLAINLWSNATSLLPSLGVPAAAIPGEPFTRMILRAGGRNVTEIDLAPGGLPNVSVRRAEILAALAAVLPDGAIRYGVRHTGVRDLAAAHDLVVVADGAGSALRASVTAPPRRRWTWNVWQAHVDAPVPEVPRDAGASVPRAGTFVGVWRLSATSVTWFVEQPDRPAGSGAALLEEMRGDPDPMVRELAARTGGFTEWRAADVWPRRGLHRGNVVLVGDAAHATLPTLGQGACQAIEDAAVLARAIAVEPALEAALSRYERVRGRRTREVVALSRAGGLGRRSNLVTRALPESALARMSASGGALLRRQTRIRMRRGAVVGT